eukprot:Rmarinus@m.13263
MRYWIHQLTERYTSWSHSRRPTWESGFVVRSRVPAEKTLTRWSQCGLMPCKGTICGVKTNAAASRATSGSFRTSSTTSSASPRCCSGTPSSIGKRASSLTTSATPCAWRCCISMAACTWTRTSCRYAVLWTLGIPWALSETSV